MKYYFEKEISWYLSKLNNDIILICISIFVLTFLVANLIAYYYNKREKWFFQNPAIWALAGLFAFLYILFHYTIMVREYYAEPHYTLEVFWSYKEAMNGNTGLLVEIIMNYVILMPEGFLVAIMFDKWKSKIKGLIAFLIGLATTMTIELIQLFARKGLFEFDDIIGNAIGMIIAYGIGCLILTICNTIKEKVLRKKISKKLRKKFK